MQDLPDTDIMLHDADMEAVRPLRIGFILVPDFTMLALAGFLDTLRLAADEGDRSRPIACQWTLMTEDGRAVRASNRALVDPDSGLADPGQFDYLVVAGGTLHAGIPFGDALGAYLARAAKCRVPLVGICTGSFVLARAGLMRGRRSCVSWFHRTEFMAEFPDLAVVSDRLFVDDRDRITCAGGTAAIHLASHLVERHLGAGRSAKGLGVMLEAGARAATAPQPMPRDQRFEHIADERVTRALLLLQQNVGQQQSLAPIARDVGLSARHLARLMQRETGMTLDALRNHLRQERARQLLVETRLPMIEIALRCGYADASHFSRRFRQYQGINARAFRQAFARR